VGTGRQIKATPVDAKRKGPKDYAFYGAIGFLGFMTIGFLGQIMKGLEGAPDKTAERTASVTAPVEPEFDGGLLKEPAEIDRPSEPQATYTLQKITYEGKGVVNVLHSRHSDQSGTWFTHAKYDCNKGTMFTLAYGEDAKALSTRGKDYKWSYLVDGSSATQVARLACKTAGLKLYVSS
jgi:hypothetical protein